jgi:anti-anti-sigma factor
MHSRDVLDSRPVGGLSVEAVAGQPSVIRVSGELDYGTAPRLRAALARMSGGDCIVDCTGLTFIDSLGIGVLVRSSLAFEAGHHRLALRNLRPSVRRTLEVCGVLDRFALEDVEIRG